MQTYMAESNKLSAVSDFNNRVFHLSWHSAGVRAETNRLRVCHIIWQQLKVFLLWLSEWKALFKPDPLFCILLQHNWTDQSVSWMHGLQSSWYSAQNLGWWYHHDHSALQTGDVWSISASWCMNKLLTSKSAPWIKNIRLHGVLCVKTCEVQLIMHKLTQPTFFKETDADHYVQLIPAQLFDIETTK